MVSSYELVREAPRKDEIFSNEFTLAPRSAPRLPLAASLYRPARVAIDLLSGGGVGSGWLTKVKDTIQLMASLVLILENSRHHLKLL